MANGTNAREAGRWSGAASPQQESELAMQCRSPTKPLHVETLAHVARGHVPTGGMEPMTIRKIRYVVAMLATVVALYAQSQTTSLEVVHADPPFGNGRTLAGTAKNVSGSTIPGDIDVVVFVFGQHGIFLGEGRDTIKGPLQTNASAQFYINVKSAGQGMTKFYMQFDTANSSLPYRVVGGSESTPLTESESGIQEVSGVQRIPTDSGNCRLRIIHISESFSRSGTQLSLTGRYRNISNDEIDPPDIRITYFDANGSYLGEETEIVYSFGVKLPHSAERGFSVRQEVPNGTVNYQLDFVGENGLKIPHCSM